MHPVGADAIDAAEAGVDELFHLDGLMNQLWPDHPPGWLELWGDPHVSEALDLQNNAADRISKTGAVITPTLSYYKSHLGVVGDPDLLPDRARSWFAEVFEGVQDDKTEKWRKALPTVQRFVELLHERGVTILAGTDVPWVLPGQSIWTEMALLSKSGLGPIEALRSATSLCSKHLRLPQIGLLEAGRCADMVFVEGDPTSAIPKNPQIPLTIRGGNVYLADRLRSSAREENADPVNDPWGAELIRRSRSLENRKQDRVVR
jgi:hypothetical protein